MASSALSQAPSDVPSEGVYGEAENSLVNSGRSGLVQTFSFAGPGHPMLSIRFSNCRVTTAKMLPLDTPFWLKAAEKTIWGAFPRKFK